MTGKFLPNKEFKRQRHISSNYIKNVMIGSKFKDGPKGLMSNNGKNSQDGAAFPDPPKRDKVGKNNGGSKWRRRK